MICHARCLVLLLGICSVCAAADWPQWRGPERNGISTETGLLQEWPSGGPKLLWQVNDIGDGFSTPAVVGDRLYLISNKGMDNEYVHCLSAADGKEIWNTTIGKVGRNEGPQYPGARSTPTVDGQRLFVLGSDGDLACLETASGKILWTVEGLGPLVYTSAVVGDGYGVAMAGYGGAAIGFKLGGSGDVTETNRLWHHTRGNPQRIGSGIIIDGLLYMFNEPGIAQCLDVKTGEDKWKERLDGGNVWGSPVLAGGLLYVTNQKGTTLVVKPSDGMQKAGALKPPGKGTTVLCTQLGRLAAETSWTIWPPDGNGNEGRPSTCSVPPEVCVSV